VSDPTIRQNRADRPRVVITGIGLVTPAGHTVGAVWNRLLAGAPTAGPITHFDASRHRVGIACEVTDLDVDAYVSPVEARRIDRVGILGIAAAAHALADAADVDTTTDPLDPTTLGIDATALLDVDPARMGIVAGSGIGGIRTLEDQVTEVAARGPSRAGPLLVPMMMPNATAALVAMRHGISGPNLAVATACATGAHAIGEACEMIRAGRADVVLAGGTEACISPVAMAAFARMGALSTNPDLRTASRPFDRDRDGFVMGEGAGFVVLEAARHAKRRGARIHGEVLGYHANGDAHHLTAPRPDGGGAVACIEAALADAGLGPAAIRHVNAHGTSTPHNDAAEAEALAKVFGAHAVPVTSTTGVTGHLIGAAGACEAIFALLAATAGVVPPIAGHAVNDLPADVVAGTARTVPAGPALSTSFAFGGHNAALVLGPAA
jgi:3-oxoacyl-[acyl-carrier-protein] synthase II